MPGIETIVVHVRPHLDEVAAIWLLKKFGEEKFPGVKDAKITFGGSGGEAPPGQSAAAWESQGRLFVGVGGGRFDEHPTLQSGRKENECAATLVAKELGVADNPALEKILQFVLNNELKAAGHPFDIASILKILWAVWPDLHEAIIKWAILALEAKYEEQRRFFEETGKEFKEKARIEEVVGPIGRPLKIATIQSDNELVNKFARSEFGGRMAVVIQQHPSGNVQIFTNAAYGLVLFDVAQMVRLEEQERKGQLVTTDWKELMKEGKVAGAEEWYFFCPPGGTASALFNGSLTAKNVPPTRIPLQRLTELVKIGISPSTFEPQRLSDCQRGTCVSSVNNPCPWYRRGLQRCRKIRFQKR